MFNNNIERIMNACHSCERIELEIETGIAKRIPDKPE